MSRTPKLYEGQVSDTTTQRALASLRRFVKDLERRARVLEGSGVAGADGADGVSANGLWAPVGDPVEVGSTVTSFTVVSGESLDTDGEWLLLLSLLLATGTIHRIRFGPGGTFSDGTNHGCELYRRYGVASSVDSGQIQLSDNLNAAAVARYRIYLSKQAGQPTLGDSTGTWDLGVDSAVFVDRTTADLERIDIGSTVASRILAGSTAQLYRRVA
jgi:hypothetical protein